MKRHFLGLSVFIFAFAIGLFLSPVWFELETMGHGCLKDDVQACAGYGYRSMYLVLVGDGFYGYDTTEKAKEEFIKQLDKPDFEETLKQEILQRSESRAVVNIERKYGFKGYCIFRVDKKSLNYICSSSLWHALEFEKQKYKITTVE